MSLPISKYTWADPLGYHIGETWDPIWDSTSANPNGIYLGKITWELFCTAHMGKFGTGETWANPHENYEARCITISIVLLAVILPQVT